MKVKVSPCLSRDELNAPVSLVTVWAEGPSLVQRTQPPARMITWEGLKAKSTICTVVGSGHTLPPTILTGVGVSVDVGVLVAVAVAVGRGVCVAVAVGVGNRRNIRVGVRVAVGELVPRLVGGAIKVASGGTGAIVGASGVAARVGPGIG